MLYIRFPIYGSFISGVLTMLTALYHVASSKTISRITFCIEHVKGAATKCNLIKWSLTDLTVIQAPQMLITKGYFSICIIMFEFVQPQIGTDLFFFST